MNDVDQRFEIVAVGGIGLVQDTIALLFQETRQFLYAAMGAQYAVQ